MPDPTDQNPQAEGEQKRKRRDELLLILLGLLTFGPTDIASALSLWDQHAPKAYRGLLDDSGDYTFDPAKQLYSRTQTDRVISPSELKRVAVTFSQSIGRDVLEPDAVKIEEHEAAVNKWAQAMGSDVKHLAIVEAALGVGGFDRLGKTAISRLIGSEAEAPGLKFTLSKLANFAVDIETRAARADSTAAIVSRAGLYARAQNTVFEQQRRDSHIDAKDPSGRATFLYERNVLGETDDHCGPGKFTMGCPELTEAGWQPIGSMPEPGLRTCGPNCLCHLRFSLTGPASEEN